MSEDSIRLTILLPRELRDRAKIKAQADDITVSQFIRRALREWVAEESQLAAEEIDDKTT